MATPSDNVKIEINIAGEPIKLSVPYDKQESVRDCEKDVNSLYSDWRHRFPRKSHSELMAMIAYQYASFFHELSARHESLVAALGNVDRALGDILSPPADSDEPISEDKDF
ncbi:MAG: cell division protein ZapA [Muribaculaceae bacterium]|nr:cell division protein ZapA [Muribaculaceae bacterium]